jgi:lipid-A-disaccharide synthase
MRIGVVAGEASGDALGASLMRAIRRHHPDAVFEGIAGPQMQALGARSLHPMEALSVRGYVEVLRSLPSLLGIRRSLVRHFLSNPPDLFVGIDSPDFNLGLEARLKRAGIPTIQMVAPTVWAWRANRLPKIRDAVNRVLSIFPFERPLFEKAGIPVTVIGHPLAQQIAVEVDHAAARTLLQLGNAAPVVALLPGSRLSELEYHAQMFIETAGLVRRHFPEAVFLVPLINSQTWNYFQKALDRCDGDAGFRMLRGHAHEALSAADGALVASGTATLEAALLKCPMVVTYRLSKLTAWIVRHRVKTRFISLPNIILDQPVVPEVIQEEATPETLSAKLVDMLQNETLRKSMTDAFRRMHQTLRVDSEQAIWEGVQQVLQHAR